jgi:O-antigen/teichoic acid export membrane protein
MNSDESAHQSHATFRTDSLAAAIGALLIMTVGQRFIGLVRNVLFCRLLQPEELGYWNLAFAIIILGAPLLVLGIPGSFGRYAEYHRQRGTLRVFLRRTIGLSTALTLFGTLLLVLCQNQVAWLIFGDSEHTRLAVLVILSLIPIIAFNLLVELCTALRQIRLLSIAQFSNSLLFAVIGVGLILWYKASAGVVIFAYAAACVVSSAIMTYPLWKSVASMRDPDAVQQHRDFWSRLMPFAFWVWFSNLCANLFTAVDRTMIVHFSGESAADAANVVGQYHSSRVVPELIVAVATLLASTLLPYLTSDWEQGRRRSVSHQINRAMKLFGIASFVGSSVFLVIAPWLFQGILQGKYASGLEALPWTLVYCIWFSQLYLAQQHLMCAERAGLITGALIVGLLANVGLNYLLLPHWGLMGAVIATAAANFITLLMTLWVCRSHGLHVQAGTVITLLLPLALTVGPIVACVASGLVVLGGLGSRVIFSAADFTSLHRLLQKRFPFINTYRMHRGVA